MSSERWNRINDLFHTALNLNGIERAEFLQKQCPDEPDVCLEVLSLLQAHEQAGDFINAGVPTDAFDKIIDPQERLLCGETIGVYQIIRELGRGGMGAVYLAARADQLYEKYVAIKLLKRGMDTDEVLRHFHNERQILAAFDHPNIARLLDGGTTGSGVPYFVMEYVEGMAIDQYCDHHRLSITQRLELFRQVCAAVSYAHRRLVIHRDIKPSNIVVTSEGVPKLLDFGIAKILHADQDYASTLTGVRMMTPEYASPEQAMGSPVTTISDVYSLGVVLYELLTGQSPYVFHSRSPLEVVRVMNTTQPVWPSSRLSTVGANLADVSTARGTSPEQLKRRLRGDLDNIVLMAIRSEPQRRYQSVDHLSEDIRRHLVGLPVIARKDTVTYRLTKFIRRNRIAVAAVVLVGLSLIAGVVATYWQAQKAKTEQARAEYAKQFGDEIRYVEALLLSTYTAPLHDTRPSLKLARERLKRIEQHMLRAGPTAFGSGHNALGNGYLFLKEYELAKDHLEKAWESGYQEPSTAYALGKTLGMLYLQALSEADKISNREIRQKSIQNARTEYADPAVRYLERARASAESPAYVEGLIALYQKQFDDGLKKTAEALKFSSRPYEVFKLKGDIYFGMGRDALSKGDHQAAVNAFHLAGQSFHKAIESGRSDQDLYLADALRIVRTISMQTREVPDTVQDGIDTCKKAIQINADNDRAYLIQAQLYFQQGINQMYYSTKDPRPVFHRGITAAEEGLKRKKSAMAYDQIATLYLRVGEYETTLAGDPREALFRAIAESEKALRINRHYAESYATLAGAYFYIAEYQSLHGEDPTHSFRKVIDVFENDLRSYRRDGYAFNVLGFAHIGLAEYKLKRGADPRQDLKRAIENYQNGLQQNPNSTFLYDGLALSFANQAKYEAQHGIDPNLSFQQALHYYNERLKAGSENGYAFFNRGLVYFARAEHKIAIGDDPASDLQASYDDFKKSLTLTGGLPPTLLQLGETHLLQAENLFLSGKDPSSELVQAQRYIDQFLGLEKSNPAAYLTRAGIQLLYARWAKKSGADPHFQRAVEDVQKSLQINALDLTAYLKLASIYRYRAELDQKSREQWIERGLETLHKAQKIDADHPELLALRATLLSLKGDSTAIGLLKEAVAKNPFLLRKYPVTIAPLR